MSSQLRHRGPDDEGAFYQQECGTGLAHSRLSIIDLSPGGHQPMFSFDDRYVVVFNGEIYNFRQIRRRLELAGEQFRTDCDTEVLLRLYQIEGVRCVNSFDGMFAFAIWDRIEHTCFLARDPLGIKPLYLWRNGKTLAFASEIRALLQAEIGPKCVCPKALYEYFLYGSVQEPRSLIRDIEVLPAGHTLVWRSGHSESSAYWTLRFSRESCSPQAAIGTTRNALDDTVCRHFVSDVPVAIFLSGGIDSTAIVALAKANGFSNLNTLCISFDDLAFNEGELAGQTAAHFGTNHVDLRLTAGDARELLSDYFKRIDQPSNDGFNSFCVSKLARDHGFKVVLSGLGGDELFGSYKSFRIIPKLMKWHKRARVLGGVGQITGAFIERLQAAERIRRAGTFLKSSGSTADAYWAVRGFFTPSEASALVEHYTGEGHFELDDVNNNLPPQPTIADEISYLEMTHYMRNQLLRDSDVMSMSWGLELRVPLADRKLIDAMAAIPSHIRLAVGKQLLLDAVPEIPSCVARRPKRGFTFPFDRWVHEQWHDIFEETRKMIGARSTWYRQWCIFTLNHFLQKNGIDAYVSRSDVAGSLLN